MNKKRKIIIWVGIVIVLAVLIIPKLNLTSGGSEKNTERDPRARQILVDIQTIVPQQLINQIYSNGTLLSNEEVELRSEISGKVTQILFDEGKHVKKGDLLLKINDAELQASLKKAKSQELLARDREFRYKQLLEKNLTSQQEYDIQASALSSTLADIELIQAQIKKTEIVAPFDGIVGLRSVSVGSYISPNTKIASIQNINPMKVDFSVPQKYFGIIKEGKTIFVKLNSNQKIYNGKIYAIEPKIDQNTRTVQVRAQIPNNQRELTPGAYVEIEIILENLNEAISVPTESIVPDFEGEKVFIVKNGIAIPVVVTTGIRTEKVVQITNGLSIGDSVITSGIIQLRPDSKVKINSVN